MHDTFQLSIIEESAARAGEAHDSRSAVLSRVSEGVSCSVFIVVFQKTDELGLIV